nr:MAG TPA: hypothetical protein [Caudoviricetes sp.]
MPPRNMFFCPKVVNHLTAKSTNLKIPRHELLFR